MSYDLVFWRYATTDGQAPQDVYARLIDGDVPPDLAELPIEDILAAVIERNPGAVRESNGPDREWIDWHDDHSSFQVEWSDRHLVVNCRQLSKDHMNDLIDIAGTFGCPL